MWTLLLFLLKVGINYRAVCIILLSTLLFWFWFKLITPRTITGKNLVWKSIVLLLVAYHFYNNKFKCNFVLTLNIHTVIRACPGRTKYLLDSLPCQNLLHYLKPSLTRIHTPFINQYTKDISYEINCWEYYDLLRRWYTLLNSDTRIDCWWNYICYSIFLNNIIPYWFRIISGTSYANLIKILQIHIALTFLVNKWVILINIFRW